MTVYSERTQSLSKVRPPGIIQGCVMCFWTQRQSWMCGCVIWVNGEKRHLSVWRGSRNVTCNVPSGRSLLRSCGVSTQPHHSLQLRGHCGIYKGKFTMKRVLRGLPLVHFLLTFTLISGSPFQYNVFQGNAYTGGDTRQRNKWVIHFCLAR